MSPRPTVVIAVTPPVEETIKHLLFGADAIVEVAASAPELAALEYTLDTLRDGAPAAVLVSADQPGLTTGLLTRLRAHGTRIIGIATSDLDQPTLEELPLDRVLRTPVEPQALKVALSAATSDATDTAATPLRRPPEEEKPRAAGTVVAVVGSRRSPGASELAASLAATAAQHWQAILAELDLLGGGLALRLGADANQGSLQALLRATQTAEGALRELVERWLITLPGWPPLLLAPTSSGRILDELDQPGATRAALDSLASHYSPVFADVGSLLDTPGGLGPLQRAHREALVTADAVVLVLGAREAQLEAGLNQLDLLRDELEIPAERLRVVCNGVGGPGAVTRPQLEQTLTAALAKRGLAVDAILPWDSKALTKATRTGLPLAAARPRGRYARTVQTLLDTIFLPNTPVARARKRLLPYPDITTPAPPREPARRAPVRDEEVTLPWRN